MATSKSDIRMANSQMLSQIAMGLMAALGAFIAFAMDDREPGALYIAAAGIGAIALVLSMIFGGRGIAKIDSPGNLFNLQAWSCLGGFVAIVSSLFLVGRPSPDESVSAVTGISERLGKIELRLEQLEAKAVQESPSIDQSTNELGTKKAPAPPGTKKKVKMTSPGSGGGN